MRNIFFCSIRSLIHLLICFFISTCCGPYILFFFFGSRPVGRASQHRIIRSQSEVRGQCEKLSCGTPEVRASRLPRFLPFGCLYLGLTPTETVSAAFRCLFLASAQCAKQVTCEKSCRPPISRAPLRVLQLLTLPTRIRRWLPEIRRTVAAPDRERTTACLLVQRGW